MKRIRGLLYSLLLLLAAGQLFAVRTVVFMYKVTVTGQDIFIKGGHDAGLVPGVYPSMSEPITYKNTKNTTTAAIKANDASLDWGSESALDWTTSSWNPTWGTKRTYAVDGYGEDPENTLGDHWWKFDVDMLGNTGDWFEFKAFMRQGTSESWENNIAQAGTPYSTINHWGKKGYITKVRFGEAWVEYQTLGTVANRAPVANFTASPSTANLNQAITFDASSSSDPDGDALQYQWDWDNNGTYDTSYSSTKTASHSWTTTGTKTIKLQVKDPAGLTSTKTLSVNIISTTASYDFREETIYFVMTTRFYDGDPNNNVHCWDDAQAGNPDSDPAWRGDFEGLIQKLDYIKALGFSAIWITPVVQNASGYDYHGYHAINFKKVDPRYKTTSDASAEVSFQRLINAAHAKGIKIIQDIVLNHSGNFGEENLYPLFKKDPTKPDTAANMIRIDGGKLPANYSTLTPGQQYSARIDAMKTDSIDTGFIYHHEKSLSWESYTVETGQIAGDCVDLNTENPTVKTYLVDAYNKYIDMGVDSFRIDTVKHISRLTFNKYYIPAYISRGGSDFYIFGEIASRYRQVWNNGIPAISCPFYTWKEEKSYTWGTRVQNEAATAQHWNDNLTVNNEQSTDNHYLYGNDYHVPNWSQRSGLDVIDFPMHWNFNNAWDAFGIAKNDDHFYADATFNVTYVDSHDYAPDGAPENQRFAGSQSTWAENLSLMFTFRGIPCLYYGSEIEFQKGKPIDVGPNAPLSTTGRAYFGDKITGTVVASGFGTYSSASGNVKTTLDYPLAQHIRRLNMFRRAIPALQKGQYSVSDISGSGMAYKRRYTMGSVDSFALITVSGSATFYNIPNGTYKDAVTGQVITVSNGSLTANCSGKGNVRIFVLDLPGNPAPGKIGNTTSYLY